VYCFPIDRTIAVLHVNARNQHGTSSTPLFAACEFFFIDLIFNPEYEVDLAFRIVGWLSTDYTALYFRRQTCSNTIETVFWDVMACILVDAYQRLGGIFCICLQGRRRYYIGNYNCRNYQCKKV
jgi:hypothetical protein